MESIQMPISLGITILYWKRIKFCAIILNTMVAEGLIWKDIHNRFLIE